MSSTTNTMPSASAPAGGRKPRKPRRVFMWTFLAAQILFLIWLITGIAGGAHTAATCHDAVIGHSGCASASEVGTTIGAGLIIGLWLAADFILGIGRLIVLTARRHSAPSGQ